jgi:hypothetical protein
MVRRLVGALVEVGAGALSPRDFAALVDGSARSGFDPAASTAPPSGLFLERVLYPGDEAPGPLAPVTPIAAGPPAEPAPRAPAAPRRPPAGAPPHRRRQPR